MKCLPQSHYQMAGNVASKTGGQDLRLWAEGTAAVSLSWAGRSSWWLKSTQGLCAAAGTCLTHLLTILAKATWLFLTNDFFKFPNNFLLLGKSVLQAVVHYISWLLTFPKHSSPKEESLRVWPLQEIPHCPGLENTMWPISVHSLLPSAWTIKKLEFSDSMVLTPGFAGRRNTK